MLADDDDDDDDGVHRGGTAKDGQGLKYDPDILRVATVAPPWLSNPRTSVSFLLPAYRSVILPRERKLLVSILDGRASRRVGSPFVTAKRSGTRRIFHRPR